MNQLKAQIQALEEQAQQLRGTIAQTQAQGNTLKAQIQNLQNQINTINTEILLTGKKLIKLKLKLLAFKKNIVTTKEKIDYQKSTIGQLLLYLAKRDNETLVGILMKNASLSDYFNQEQYALTVNSNLLHLVEELNQDQANLINQKNDLEDKKKGLQTLKQQETAQKHRWPVFSRTKPTAGHN